MSLTVNTASTSSLLTELETVKRELGTTGVTNDKILYDLIQQASDFIESYTGRVFKQETVTEFLPSRGSRYMILTRTPVNSVNFVEFDGSSVSSTSYEIDDPDSGVIYKESAWANTNISQHFITESYSRWGRRDWEIKYTGGYKLPGETGRTLPYDIERACIDLVKTWYLQRTNDPTLKSEKVGDASYTKFGLEETGGGLSPSTLRLLEPWRRHDITLWR